MSVVDRLVRRVRRSADHAARVLSSPAPVRPVVVIQSDDWGRVGVPSLPVFNQIRQAVPGVGDSRWDFYGLETTADLEALGNELEAIRDTDDAPACITGNFIMANADLRLMAENGFARGIYKPISEGFPPPWTDSLVTAYRALVDRKVFYPGLHGFTHFNASVLEGALADPGDLGERARLLARLDTPYLRSVTPEYNFALLSMPAGSEVFLPAERQKQWLESGIQIFEEVFGFRPVTFCAPGYRSNDVTRRLLEENGVAGIQLPSKAPPVRDGGLVVLGRNVAFEPALWKSDRAALIEQALADGEAAVARGTPIIICSHSINYMTRFLDRAEEARSDLALFLGRLKDRFPDLRFAGDADLIRAWKLANPAWFRPPTLREQAERLLEAGRDRP